MYIRSTKFFCRDYFACSSFDQWWPTEEDRPIATHNHRLIAHRRYIGTTSRTRTHDRRNLWDALTGHTCLIIEDTPEVFAIRKNISLQRQKCSSRIDQV